ncbi:MAG TPA: hypothetical protein VMH80_26950 [Bryobacteraceae bacterium]|nr:hypothetical protein [Bryobacteraceae bacterium]
MKASRVIFLLPAMLLAQDPIPQLAVSYFHALSCPAGWAPYAPAQGRTIVPVAPSNGVLAAVNTPLKDGENRTHSHSISTSINTGSNGYIAFTGCCNDSLATGGTKSISATSNAVSANLPYVELLACQKQDAPQPGPIPRGTAIFYEGLRCPTGWSELQDAEGRFPVAEQQPYGAFGGPPLQPREDRAHSLSYSGSVKIPGQAILAFGGGAEGFANSGTYHISGSTSSSSTGMPYLQLLQCSKDSEGAPMVSSVLNAADFGSGAVAPGQIVSIFGDNLGPDPGVGAQLVDGKLPTSLAGVQVNTRFGPAPLFYVSKTQINAQIPYETLVTTLVEVAYQEQSSNQLTLPFASSAPGLFTNNPPNSDLAIAVLGSQLVSAQVPIAQGQEFVMYATGGGLTSPASVTGAPRNPPLAMPILPVTVTIGGVDATLDYKGAAPGFVGLMQINAHLGGGTPSGKQAVVLKIGDATSPSGVYLYVK